MARASDAQDVQDVQDEQDDVLRLHLELLTCRTLMYLVLMGTRLTARADILGCADRRKYFPRT